MKKAFFVFTVICCFLISQDAFSVDKKTKWLLKLVEKKKNGLKIKSRILDNPRSAQNMLSHLSQSDLAL